MTSLQTFIRKVIYLVCIMVLLTLLSILGRPAIHSDSEGGGSPGGILAQISTEHELSPGSLGKIDPTSEAMKVATFGLRGLAANILWNKAEKYKEQKDWTNLKAVLEQIATLQPN